ncbi:hypothetical protein ACCO45_001518 [Purpureocillium lilacinum]|uniref:Uncharacterized protein n=1 Tax=Purpureocillium lilacinum TaxID=33203 RepID=A0ACC4E9V1_PURLI
MHTDGATSPSEEPRPNAGPDMLELEAIARCPDGVLADTGAYTPVDPKPAKPRHGMALIRGQGWNGAKGG